MRLLRFPGFAAAIFLVCAGVSGAAKRPITHQDYDGWRNIQNQRLSPDGKYVAYAMFPEDGDGEFVVRNLATGKEWREPIGRRPDPPKPDFANPGPEEPQRRQPGITIAFTHDGGAVAFSTFPTKAEYVAARKAKKKTEDMPKGGLTILDLASGKADRVERVKSFQIPENADGYIAYLHFGEKDSGVLALRRIADSSERSFADVAEYALTDDGALLAYAVVGKDAEHNGVYTVRPGGDGAPIALQSGAGKYAKLTWNEKQTVLAFLSSHDDAAAKHPRFKLHVWERGTGASAEIVSTDTAGFPPGFAINEKGAVAFSKDGDRVFFGSSPQREEVAKADASADERPSFDLWSWKDDYIQPMQKVLAETDRNRSYRAVYHLREKKFVQLAGLEMAELTPSEDGRWALGGDNRAYRSLVDHDQRYEDAYLVDTATGARKLVAQKHIGKITWSPDGGHALLFDGKNWNSISVPDGKCVNLTANLGVNFWQEEHDIPGSAESYGLAGWTSDGRYVLVYDRYDVWSIRPDGSLAKNLTLGTGRKQHLMFRYVKLNPDPKDKWIDPSRPLLLRAENTETRDSGFYRTAIDSPEPPVKLTMAAKNFSGPVKAKNADVLLLTASTFNEFPDLEITDSSFREMRKVSDANPQKAELLWGSTEMFEYRNADGRKLPGALYKPEGFDPKKKYPMLVYIYERLSQNINHFVPPAPGHSINISYYVSNGYLVMTPDIAYSIGYPGESALKCVLAAVQEIAGRGYVDENAIGIQGHSWGGYQIAYMVTRTNRFRAASAGAPVADMISAYDGIRWGPGLPRQFQYERTQSRIGGSLWEYPMRYIENSPIFMADRVSTPLLMLHNDADDAVPWYQGIEYYLALRRLGKEVYLFTYHGEPHHLDRRPNQKDYTIRLQQFFDYYLKGAAKPAWMERGIPYLENPGIATDTGG
jgi:dipeptidyl aminopeptidase/acylaminoacyl peptidase